MDDSRVVYVEDDPANLGKHSLASLRKYIESVWIPYVGEEALQVIAGPERKILLDMSGYERDFDRYRSSDVEAELATHIGNVANSNCLSDRGVWSGDSYPVFVQFKHRFYYNEFPLDPALCTEEDIVLVRHSGSVYCDSNSDAIEVSRTQYILGEHRICRLNSKLWKITRDPKRAFNAMKKERKLRWKKELERNEYNMYNACTRLVGRAKSHIDAYIEGLLQAKLNEESPAYICKLKLSMDLHGREYTDPVWKKAAKDATGYTTPANVVKYATENTAYPRKTIIPCRPGYNPEYISYTSKYLLEMLESEYSDAEVTVMKSAAALEGVSYKDLDPDLSLKRMFRKDPRVYKLYDKVMTPEVLRVYKAVHENVNKKLKYSSRVRKAKYPHIYGRKFILSAPRLSVGMDSSDSGERSSDEVV